jgi:hypothetical protein
MSMVLLLPMQMSLSDEMRQWASECGLLQEAAHLPALMKPYLRLPMDQLTLGVRHACQWRGTFHTEPQGPVFIAESACRH